MGAHEDFLSIVYAFLHVSENREAQALLVRSVQRHEVTTTLRQGDLMVTSGAPSADT